MKFFALVLVLFAFACGSDPVVLPDPSMSHDGGGGSSAQSSTASETVSSSVASTSAGAGTGGASGGLTCDPCENKDGSRIVRRAYLTTTPDGLVYRNPVSGFYDLTLDVPCGVMTAEDKQTRCIPSGSGSVMYFSDNSCTTPIAMAPSQMCAASMIPYATRTVLPIAPCDPLVYEIFKIGPVYTGPMYNKSTGGSCVQTTALPGYTYYAATKVDPTTFAAVSQTLEPVP